MATNKEDWRETVKNLKSKAQIYKMGVDGMRSLIPKLTVECFFADEFSTTKARGLWERVKPRDWPANLPFRDPNNSKKEQKKMGKWALRDVLLFLVKRYKAQNNEVFEDFPGSSCGSSRDGSEGLEQPGPSNVVPQASREGSRASSALSFESNRSGPPTPDDSRQPVIRRLREWLRSATHTQQPTTDKLRTVLASKTFRSKAVNKTMLRLLHSIECYVELDPRMADPADDAQFAEDVENLVCEMNRCEVLGKSQSTDDMDSLLGALESGLDSDSDDSEFRPIQC